VYVCVRVCVCMCVCVCMWCVICVSVYVCVCVYTKESDTTQELNKNNKLCFNLRNGIISYKIFFHLLLCCEKFLILLISFMIVILNGCKGIPSKEHAVNYLTNPQLWVINFVSKQRIWHPAKLLLIYQENMPLNTFSKNEKI